MNRMIAASAATSQMMIASSARSTAVTIAHRARSVIGSEARPHMAGRRSLQGDAVSKAADAASTVPSA